MRSCQPAAITSCRSCHHHSDSICLASMRYRPSVPRSGISSPERTNPEAATSCTQYGSGHGSCALISPQRQASFDLLQSQHSVIVRPHCGPPLARPACLCPSSWCAPVVGPVARSRTAVPASNLDSSLELPTGSVILPPTMAEAPTVSIAQGLRWLPGSPRFPGAATIFQGSGCCHAGIVARAYLRS